VFIIVIIVIVFVVVIVVVFTTVVLNSKLEQHNNIGPFGQQYRALGCGSGSGDGT
jgi:hypothetical protein